MIKFLLGFVAIIVVLLIAYMFTNKPTETAKKETISKVKKQDVSKTEIEVSKVKTSKKVLSVTKPLKKDIQKKISEVGETETSIGKGLTLESIENMNTSDEEKQIMIGKMLYYQTTHRPESQINSLSHEEIYNQIHNDMKKLNNQ